LFPNRISEDCRIGEECTDNTSSKKKNNNFNRIIILVLNCEVEAPFPVGDAAAKSELARLTSGLLSP